MRIVTHVYREELALPCTRCRSLGAIGTQSNSYWTLDNVLLRVQGYFYLSLSPGR
jgi:hypothetical protein